MAFTDGSAFKNPSKKYGYSFVITKQNGEIVYIHSHVIENKQNTTTCIVAELTAVLKCLQKINRKKYYPVIIYTDSQYIEKIYNLQNIAKVHKNIWEKINKEKNKKITLEWVKSHYNNCGNIVSDKIIRLCNSVFLNINL